MSGGKGGSSNTSSSSYSSQSGSVQLPDWLNNASQQAVSAASQLQAENYAPQYTGEMVAAPSALTNQYYNAVQGMQGMGQGAYDAASNAYQCMLSQLAPQTAGGINALSNQLYGNYLGNVVNPSLTRLHWMGTISGLIFINCSIFYNLSKYTRARIFSPTHVLVLLMLLLTEVNVRDGCGLPGFGKYSP